MGIIIVPVLLDSVTSMTLNLIVVRLKTKVLKNQLNDASPTFLLRNKNDMILFLINKN